MFTVHQVQSIVINVSYHEHLDLKCQSQLVKLVSGEIFLQWISCLSTGKAAKGLKERKFVFIMLLGLFALLSLPLDSKLPACLSPL